MLYRVLSTLLLGIAGPWNQYLILFFIVPYRVVPHLFSVTENFSLFAQPNSTILRAD